MRIQPIVPVVPLRNDASTNSDQRPVQKKESESVAVHLGTHKSSTGVSRMTKERAIEFIKWLDEL